MAFPLYLYLRPSSVCGSFPPHFSAILEETFLYLPLFTSLIGPLTRLRQSSLCHGATFGTTSYPIVWTSYPAFRARGREGMTRLSKQDQHLPFIGVRAFEMPRLMLCNCYVFQCFYSSEQGCGPPICNFSHLDIRCFYPSTLTSLTHNIPKIRGIPEISKINLNLPALPSIKSFNLTRSLPLWAHVALNQEALDTRQGNRISCKHSS